MGGNYRFKFSDIVPNAWFYKLKDLSKAIKSKSRGQNPKSNQKSFQIKQNSLPKREVLVPSRSSYYFESREEAEKPHSSPLHPRASDTLFPQQSSKKSNKRSRRKPNSPKSTIFSYKLQLQLSPIMTKPMRKETEQTIVEEKKQSKNLARKSPTGIHRLRMRANSPRFVGTKNVQANRKSVSKQENGISKSFAIVKSSTNPPKDFRDSMVEMISENNIRTSKELEELLACYLLLNANEYHDVIIKVFKKIWFDLTDISL